LAVDGCAATYGTYYGLGRGRGAQSAQSPSCCTKFRRYVVGYYHLFVICAVLNVSLAINLWINCSFLNIYITMKQEKFTISYRSSFP